MKKKRDMQDILQNHLEKFLANPNYVVQLMMNDDEEFKIRNG